MEDDKVSPANKKKQLKTPAQVAVLERVYNGHRYPSREMKSQLAEKIGLTEKQVSGWFCRKRSKDRRLSRDKQGSGLRQESCGSTNIAYCRVADPREGESGQPSLDTSSESSSSGNEALEAKNSQLVEPNPVIPPEQVQFPKEYGKHQNNMADAGFKEQVMEMLERLQNQDTTNMDDLERKTRCSLMDSLGKCLAKL